MTLQDFIKYYKKVLNLHPQDFNNLLETLYSPLPSSFRILNKRLIKNKIENILLRNSVSKNKFIKNVFDNEFRNFKCRQFIVNQNDVGFIQRQEVVSMLPVLLMGLERWHSVLDMCAAPGSKTKQILEICSYDGGRECVENEENICSGCVNGSGFNEGNVGCIDSRCIDSGNMDCVDRRHNNNSIFNNNNTNDNNSNNKDPYITSNNNKDAYMTNNNNNNNPIFNKHLHSNLIVANDCSSKRLNVLITETQKIKHPSLLITKYDASHLPIFKTDFDRVLCDVPCSGDGTIRKSNDMLDKWNIKNGLGLHKLQVEILRRATKFVTDGLIVYSTCSLNPVENECVVQKVVCEEDLEIVDLRFNVCSGSGLNVVDGVCNGNVDGENFSVNCSVDRNNCSMNCSMNGKCNENCNMSVNCSMKDEENMINVNGNNCSIRDEDNCSINNYMNITNNNTNTMNITNNTNKENFINQFKFRPGLTTWDIPECDVKPLEKDIGLSKCIRVYPHDQDTGGFFIVGLRKKKHVDIKIRNYKNKNNYNVVDSEIVRRIVDEYGCVNLLNDNGFKDGDDNGCVSVFNSGPDNVLKDGNINDSAVKDNSLKTENTENNININNNNINSNITNISNNNIKSNNTNTVTSINISNKNTSITNSYNKTILVQKNNSKNILYEVSLQVYDLINKLEVVYCGYKAYEKCTLSKSGYRKKNIQTVNISLDGEQMREAIRNKKIEYEYERGNVGVMLKEFGLIVGGFSYGKVLRVYISNNLQRALIDLI